MHSSVYVNYFKDSARNRFPTKEISPIAEYKRMNIGEKLGVGKEDFIMGKLSEIVKEIELSKYILDLEDDFDDEGSPAYQYLTWERSVNFLKRMAKTAIRSFNVLIDAPKIYHGPKGGIDMAWENENYRLLVNFPQDITQAVVFYGEVKNKETVKGSFTLDGGNNLMMFLVGVKNV